MYIVFGIRSEKKLQYLNHVCLCVVAEELHACMSCFTRIVRRGLEHHQTPNQWSLIIALLNSKGNMQVTRLVGFTTLQKPYE